MVVRTTLIEMRPLQSPQLLEEGSMEVVKLFSLLLDLLLEPPLHLRGQLWEEPFWVGLS